MDRVLTAIERAALPKQMLYSDFVGGSTGESGEKIMRR
jgi:hypothetical protein